MSSFIKRISLRNSVQQRQSIHQDRRKTTKGVPLFQNIRIAIVGDAKVGKSSLAMQYCKETFVEEYEQTIEDEYTVKKQFVFRLPMPEEGDPHNGDIFGYKQMELEFDKIPTNLQEQLKVTLTALKEQKEEKVENNSKEKTSKLKAFFSRKKQSSNSTSTSSTNNTETNENENSDYLIEQQVICTLTVVDTSGDERTRKEVSKLGENIDGFLVVYDMTNKASFVHLQQYVEEITKCYFGEDDLASVLNQPLNHKSISLSNTDLNQLMNLKVYPPMVLAMNKSDSYSTSNHQQVHAEYGYTFGETYKVPFYVTSAKERLNIDECFESLISEIIKRKIEEGSYETETPMTREEEKLARQSISATLRQYVSKQIKKK
ncbi:hypothetical protein ABK040_014948 [Willaertia magna]